MALLPTSPTRTKMATIQIDMPCICGFGMMRPFGTTPITDKPVFAHKCTNCGITASYDECYPYLTYEPALGV